MIHRERRDELGVSEVVGFIIVLGIVFMSIGMVYANAIPVLEDNREHQHITNTEKIFNTLDGNVDELTERDVTRRATHIRLFDSEVSIGENRYPINVSNGTEWNFFRNGASITYQHGEEQIVYENGAVIRTSTARNDSAMLMEPGWTVRENRDGPGETALIQTAVFTGDQRISGDGPILVRKDLDLTTDVIEEAEVENELVLRITSDYSDAWLNYFEGLEDRYSIVDGVSEVNDDTAEIEFDIDSTDRLIFKDNVIRTSITT